jgi:connective tissue growth factor
MHNTAIRLSQISSSSSSASCLNRVTSRPSSPNVNIKDAKKKKSSTDPSGVLSFSACQRTTPPHRSPLASWTSWCRVVALLALGVQLHAGSGVVIADGSLAAVAAAAASKGRTACGVGSDCIAGRDVDSTSSYHQQMLLQSHAVQNDQPPVRSLGYVTDCKYACNCTQKETCKFAVNEIMDGCNCCYMCARQQGDLCNTRDKCDEEKGLYCHMMLDGGVRGICRAKAAKPCSVLGKTYKDGEDFKPNCSQLCTCQDGRYACSSLCPQELRPPSSAHCRVAQLVAISGKCCREWVCPHSHSLVDDSFSNESPATEISRCKIESTQWSSCSQTCGLGVSIRMTADKNCQPLQERRLCIVRPCETDDRTSQQPKPSQSGGGGGNKDCRSMWRDRSKRRIQYGKCESVAEFQLKYCSTCKRNKCCGPGQDRTIPVKFKCPGETELKDEQLMIIKTCKCFKLKDCPFL